MKPFCITFAGPAGCSKTPVAQYLSCQLGLPVFANDTVRSETKEDHMSFEPDDRDYTERVISRLKDLIERKVSFIYDASNDRHWDKFLQNFDSPDAYDIGVISYDLHPAFYKALLTVKHYDQGLAGADNYLAHHQAFMEQHADTVICSINDDKFPDRLEVALQAARQFIDDRKTGLR